MSEKCSVFGKKIKAVLKEFNLRSTCLGKHFAKNFVEKSWIFINSGNLSGKFPDFWQHFWGGISKITIYLSMGTFLRTNIVEKKDGLSAVFVHWAKLLRDLSDKFWDYWEKTYYRVFKTAINLSKEIFWEKPFETMMILW